jgi:guanylate kinase
MQAAKSELEYIDRYQYTVLNDEVDVAFERLNAIIETEKSRKKPQ